MKLRCLWVDGQRVEIRPAPRRRDWMDATQQGLPYRCIPLSVANVHGWELLCPYSFEVEWTGAGGSGSAASSSAGVSGER